MAQYSLGLLYKEGGETEKNLKKAIYRFEKAAKNGYVEAQYKLALYYQLGVETEKSLEKAIYWF